MKTVTGVDRMKRQCSQTGYRRLNDIFTYYYCVLQGEDIMGKGREGEGERSEKNLVS